MILDEIKNSSFYELIDKIEKRIKKSSKENYRVMKQFRINKDNPKFNDYISIDLRNWQTKEKEQLLKNILIGINHFHLNLSYNEAVDVGAFNSVLDAVNGKEFVFVYRNTIKWFDDEVLRKLLSEGIDIKFD